MHKNRNISVDTFKFLSIFMVVVHHTKLFYYSYDQYGGYVLLLLKYFFYAIRFGIPVFFIAAGYYFGCSHNKGKPLGRLVKRYCIRLGELFVLWTLVYFLLPPNFVNETQQFGYIKPFIWHWDSLFTYIYNYAKDYPLTLIFMGSFGHLWFFPAYIIGIIILSLFIYFKKENYIIPFGVLLYCLCLLGRSYHMLPMGFETDFQMGRGPFVSTLFIAIGWKFSTIDFSKIQSKAVKTAVLLIISGLLIQFAENWILFKNYNMIPEHEYLIGLVPLGIGVFLLALGYPNLGQSTIFPLLGRYTLGVYALHEFFLKLLLPLRGWVEPIIWDILFPVVIYGLSFAVTMMLLKSYIGRRFVAQ